MKKVTATKNMIRFRRWSRKAYAVFSSLGRQVTIGCLRKSVVDASLSKQKSEIFFITKDSESFYEEAEEYKQDISPDLLSKFIEILQPQKKVVNVSYYGDIVIKLIYTDKPGICQ